LDIKASDVKALRAKTGAGMLDCKNALVATDGDFQQAEKKLKELGLAAAAKRSGKAANEGRVFSSVTDSRAALVELSCETDFVARNQAFIDVGTQVTQIVIENALEEASDEILAIVDDVKSKIKENMGLKRLKSITVESNAVVADYIHGEGKIGVLVKATVDSDALLSNDDVKSFVFDCALHIAAFNPLYLTREDVDPEYLKEQEEIFTTQAENLGKPENVVAGIVKGKLNKHLSEIVLLEQGFVKDEKKKVTDMMKEVGKNAGGVIKLTEFVYYRVGQDA
jgi:elongation factor Ts